MEDFTDYKLKFQELISRNDFDTLFQELKIMLSETRLLKEVLFQSGRFYSLKNAIKYGMISEELKQIGENKIRLALLDLLDEIEKNYKNNCQISRKIDNFVKGKSIIYQNFVKNGDLVQGNKIVVNDNSLKLIISVLLPVLVTILVVTYLFVFRQDNGKNDTKEAVNLEMNVTDTARLIPIKSESASKKHSSSEQDRSRINSLVVELKNDKSKKIEEINNSVGNTIKAKIFFNDNFKNPILFIDGKEYTTERTTLNTLSFNILEGEYLIEIRSGIQKCSTKILVNSSNNQISLSC